MFLTILGLFTLWMIVGTSIVFAISMYEKDTIYIRDLPIMLFLTVIWPVAIVIWSIELLEKRQFGDRVMFDFSEKSDED